MLLKSFKFATAKVTQALAKIRQWCEPAANKVRSAASFVARKVSPYWRAAVIAVFVTGITIGLSACQATRYLAHGTRKGAVVVERKMTEYADRLTEARFRQLMGDDKKTTAEMADEVINSPSEVSSLSLHDVIEHAIDNLLFSVTNKGRPPVRLIHADVR